MQLFSIIIHNNTAINNTILSSTDYTALTANLDTSLAFIIMNTTDPYTSIQHALIHAKDIDSALALLNT